MDEAWILLIIFLFIALTFSFLCSVLEAVVLSITPSYVASQKGTFAEQLEDLKRDIDKPLSAILTLNTFAHTIGAAGVGAAAQDIWGEAALAVISAVVTIIILIGSEIVPKTIGAVYWRQLARPVLFITRWMTITLYPVVWMCQGITRLLRHGEKTSVLSRNDLSSVASLGYRDGLVYEHEKRIISNLMAKDALQTQTVMTPLERLVSLPGSMALHTFSVSNPAWHLSRVPVYGGNVNEITGYVLKDEILSALLKDEKDQTVADLQRPIVRVSAEESLVALYRRLVDAHEHIAIVHTPEGETAGVVTMEDVIEELLGQEIVDESDRIRGVLD